MADYIHGQTDDREVARLEKQARFGAATILQDFDAAPGTRVLDLATGVGAMAGQLLQRYPGIRLTGVDLKLSQLRRARQNHPGPGYVQSDGTRLPFRDGTFERVHCSWMLEHVPDPGAVLAEVRRVLAAGGYCHFIEVDNSTFRTVPEYPEVVAVLDEMNRTQAAGGGDPFIGKRLDALFTGAGLRNVQVKPAVLFGSHQDPTYFAAFIEEFAEIFESLDEALAPKLGAQLPAAAARLRGLLQVPGAQMHYTGSIGRGFR